jgi:hypothetical protein
MVGSLGGLGAYFDFDKNVVSGIALGSRLTGEENFAVDGYSGLSPLRCDLSHASMIGGLGSPGAYFDFGEEAVAVIALSSCLTREENFAVDGAYHRRLQNSRPW